VICEPDDEVLEVMTESIGYEIHQLAGCMTLLKRGEARKLGDPAAAGITTNALLESALIHCRSLDDFFGLLRTEGTTDDVFATDFDPEWPARRVLNGKERASINKRLAHLTTQRISGPERWELQAFDRMLNTFADFLDGLEQRQPARRQWFKIDRASQEWGRPG
jgi:hypothetical protein